MWFYYTEINHYEFNLLTSETALYSGDESVLNWSCLLHFLKNYTNVSKKLDKYFNFGNGNVVTKAPMSIM